MNSVEYKAINSSNKIICGSTTEDQLIRLETLLTDQGLRLISYRLKKHTAAKKLTYPQQHILWMSLRYYMMSKFTLVDAIKHMLHSSVDVKLQNILQAVCHRLHQGEMFSRVMKHYLPKDDILSLSLLESAENTGDYLEILYDLEEYASWQINFKGTIQQALRYPSIVFGALWISIFCILYFFAPQLSSYFQQTNYQVPVFTQTLIKLSQFIIAWPWVWLGSPLIFIVSIKVFYKSLPNLRSMGLYLPVIRSIILGYYYTSISKVLYLQLKHGHSLIESFRGLERAYRSDWIHPILINISNHIEKGMTLSVSLKKYKWFFSKFFLQLIDVGEQSNTLGENFKVISAYYERDTQYKTMNLIKLIEPLMLVFMGILLIVIVGGLFYPMYQQIGTSTGGL